MSRLPCHLMYGALVFVHDLNALGALPDDARA